MVVVVAIVVAGAGAVARAEALETGTTNCVASLNKTMLFLCGLGIRGQCNRT